MTSPSVVGQLGLWILTLLVIASAALVVLLGNLFRAALSLGLVLLGVAGLFVLLEAEFLAFVQVLVYVGAILTLVVFAMMLTAKLQRATVPQTSRQRLPAAVVAGTLFVVLMFVIQSLAWTVTPPADAVSLPHLGQTLITTLVLPFEVISLVFVAAIVGAIAVASAPSPRQPSSSPTRR